LFPGEREISSISGSGVPARYAASAAARKAQGDHDDCRAERSPPTLIAIHFAGLDHQVVFTTNAIIS
jgi:hypothetical protein